jgi:SAM-dependent methyltransferase
MSAIRNRRYLMPAVERRTLKPRSCRENPCQMNPQALDLIGYELIVDEILRRDGILSVPGDLIEIGTLMGGGTTKIAKYLAEAGSEKQLWTVDLFDTDADPTINAAGRTMTDIYRCSVPADGSWRSTVEANFAAFPNIRLLQGDSTAMALPMRELCFAMIDGNHQPAHVAIDFENCWRLLSPGGVLAMHDFGGDLPEVTSAIKACIASHQSEIDKIKRFPERTLISIKKRHSDSLDLSSARIAVLFCHHRKDPLTLRHLELLRECNAADSRVEVIPCGFSEADLVEGALRLAPDERLPKNRVPRLAGRWGEIDLLLYQFSISGRAQAYDRVIFVESDCRVTRPIREVFGESLAAPCAAHVVQLGTGTCGGWNHWQDIAEWKRLLIGQHAGGVTPINGFFCSAEVLRKVTEGLIRSPRLFEDMLSEVRLCVACRMFAEDPGSLIWMEHVNEWFHSEHRDPEFGFLHPVKEL